MSNLMKMSQVGAEIFPCGQTDRRSDMTKLTVAFRNFADALKVINIIRKRKTRSYNSFYTSLLTYLLHGAESFLSS